VLALSLWLAPPQRLADPATPMESTGGKLRDPTKNNWKVCGSLGILGGPPWQWHAAGRVTITKFDGYTVNFHNDTTRVAPWSSTSAAMGSH